MALLSTLLSPWCPPGGCLSTLAAASPQQGEDSSPPLPPHLRLGFGLFWVILVYISAPSALLEQKESINAASRAGLSPTSPAGNRPLVPPCHKVLAQARMLGGSSEPPPASLGRESSFGPQQGTKDGAAPGPSAVGAAGGRMVVLGSPNRQ